MSVRAYKVKKIDTELSDTFNLWHDDELMDIIGSHINEDLNADGAGLIWINKNEAEQWIKEAKKQKVSKDTMAKLKAILKDTDNDSEGIHYYCF